MWWLDTAEEKADEGSSVSSDAETENSVSDATGERETAATRGADSQEHSSGDAGDSILEKELAGQGSSDSEMSEASDEPAAKAEDSTGEPADTGVPASEETIRDRLEKAGVRTTGKKSLMISCWSW